MKGERNGRINDNEFAFIYLVIKKQACSLNAIHKITGMDKEKIMTAIMIMKRCGVVERRKMSSTAMKVYVIKK